MKNIQFVADTTLLGFITSTLLTSGNEPVIKVSRKPDEGYLGEKVLVTFTPPSEGASESITSFLERVHEMAPTSLHLLP